MNSKKQKGKMSVLKLIYRKVPGLLVDIAPHKI